MPEVFTDVGPICGLGWAGGTALTAVEIHVQPPTQTAPQALGSLAEAPHII